jgi:Flp pilus assembly protein TadG
MVVHAFDCIRLIACRKATAAIEFAIVFPIFLMLLFGIVSFGAYLAVVHGVQQLAAEATRAAIGGLSDSERLTLATDNIAANASFYPLIEMDRLTVTQASTDPTTRNFSITLRYDASDMFVFSLPSFVPAPPSTIVRSASIQKGGY